MYPNTSKEISHNHTYWPICNVCIGFQFSKPTHMICITMKQLSHGSSCTKANFSQEAVACQQMITSECRDTSACSMQHSSLRPAESRDTAWVSLSLWALCGGAGFLLSSVYCTVNTQVNKTKYCVSLYSSVQSREIFVFNSGCKRASPCQPFIAFYFSEA